MKKGPRPIPMFLRLMRHTSAPDENGCWKWTGASADWGHGRIWRVGRSSVGALRAMYEEVVGEIPEGKMVLHRCNVPACVNPFHLYLGTAKDNTADMIDAGTFPEGERSPCSKLTNATVATIRKEWDGSETMRAVGARYGVSAATIHRVVHRALWKGVV